MTPNFAIEMELARDPRSPSAARRALDGLARRLPGEVLDRCRVVVSELVTNALQHAPHGDDPLRLAAALEDDRVSIQVADSGSGFDALARRPDAAQESGYGLYLVDRMCDRWGVEGDHHTIVWCEIDVDQRSREGGGRRLSA
jgi:anti-sigma regulatory factor (Ser/Thr protein kinase)